MSPGSRPIVRLALPARMRTSPKTSNSAPTKTSMRPRSPMALAYSSDKSLPRRPLLRNHSARNAVAGVTGRIGLHVVRFGVNHDGRATVGKERIGFAAISQHDVFILDGCLRHSIGFDGKVRHVAGVMSVGIVETVLLAGGIEMPAGRLEVRWITLWVLVEMYGVLPWRQVFEVQFHFHTLLLGLNGCGPDAVALGVLQLDGLLGDRLGLCKSSGSANSECRTNYEQANYELVFHSLRVVPRNRWSGHVSG